jgi:hypothetical protein
MDILRRIKTILAVRKLLNPLWRHVEFWLHLLRGPSRQKPRRIRGRNTEANKCRALGKACIGAVFGLSAQFPVKRGRKDLGCGGGPPCLLLF